MEKFYDCDFSCCVVFSLFLSRFASRSYVPHKLGLWPWNVSQIRHLCLYPKSKCFQWDHRTSPSSVSEPDDGYCSPFFNTSTVSNVTFGLVSSEWNTLSLTFFETQNALPITFPNYFSYGFSFDELSMNCVWFQLLSFAHVTFEVIALLTYPDTFQGLTCYFFSVSKVQPKSFILNIVHRNDYNSEISYRKAVITFWYIVLIPKNVDRWGIFLLA